MFSYFKVPKELEPRVLNYGIYGAAVLRGIFIRATHCLAHYPPKFVCSGRSQVLPIFATDPLLSLVAVLGAKLLEEFRPVLLLFAALLVYSSFKVLVGGNEVRAFSFRSSRGATSHSVAPLHRSFSSAVQHPALLEPPLLAVPSPLRQEEDEDEDLEKNPVIRLSRKLVNVSNSYDGDKFFTVVDGAS